LVVLLESVHFALAPSGQQFGKTGLPQWVGPALGGSEAIASLLFLMLAGTPIGGYLLLAIFAIAIPIHFAHGEFDVSSLIVYGMAVLVCITQRKHQLAEVSDER
jgi:uncharacterized membrane protein YgaE (UPF0421/DUF939 family)